MKNIYFLFVLVIFFLAENLSAQGVFSEFNTSHYARTIRLGNTYTGIAEGAEALYYNAAGIANSNSYELLFSRGQGFGFFVEGIRAYDYAIVAQLPFDAGNVGFSVQTLFSSFHRDIQQNIFDLSYAHQFFNSLSVGLTVGYYNFHAVSLFPFGDWTSSEKGSAVDLSLGVLYQLPSNMKISDQDDFKIGFSFKNFLNSKIKLEPTDNEYYLNQKMRAGISYRFVPEFSGTEAPHLLQFMAAIDFVYTGQDYDFWYCNPNYGIEITVYDILELSFGRENQITLHELDYIGDSPQYPVSRYGFGLNLPINYLFDNPTKIILNFDYCKSDWDQINEDNVNHPYFSIKEMDDDAFSIGLSLQLN